MSFESSFIASKSFEDKAVVLRVDYNVPIEKGVLLDDERLLRSCLLYTSPSPRD